MASLTNQVVVIIKKNESELIHLEQQSFPGKSHTLTAPKSLCPLSALTGSSLPTPGTKSAPVVAPSEGTKAPHWELSLSTGWF